MTSLRHHLRGLLVAITALALSAGVVFAASPHAATGLAGATSASGQTVPANLSGLKQGDAQDEQGTDDSNDKTEAPDAADTGSADNCTTDPTGLTAQELAALGHGSVVCWAAHQGPQNGYANHGAFVSHWAKQNAGAGHHDAGTTHKP